MDNILPLSKATPRDPDQELYSLYSRPLQSRLLEAMELAKSFHSGEGNYLYYDQNDETKKVLDLSGGNGSNLLGHRNPQILASLLEWHNQGTPAQIPGSIRASTGKLAQRISGILEAETSEGPWVTTFTNTGLEALEAAKLHCLLHHKNKMTDLGQEAEKEINLALLALKKLDEKEVLRVLKSLRLELSEKIDSLSMNQGRKSYLLHQLANVHDIENLADLLREINSYQMNQKPLFITLENSVDENSLFISPYIDSEKLDTIINEKQQDLILLSLSHKGVILIKQSFSLIAGALAEPIQNEAGLIPLPGSFLAMLKKYSLQEDFLLVFDEIQAGIFRTGTMTSGAQTDITADIYTFSNSLGGGVAKIGATSIIQRKYVEEFSLLHKSPLSEDDLSSVIALKVLDILQSDESPLPLGLKAANYLWARLVWLKTIYPEVISDVRGKGLMQAIEFQDIFSELGFEFKAICDSRMQGFLMASALLNHEDIRLEPSVNAHLTLKVQPSVYLDVVQVEGFIAGLSNMCEAMKHKNIRYLLSALYPDQVINDFRTPALPFKVVPSERPLAVFLCHLIDQNHIKKVSTALNQLPNEKLLEKLAKVKDISEFSVYHTQTITDKNGKEMDIVMLGIAVTSEELKKTFISKNRHKVIRKVQSAIDFAKSIGASTVGLGQFTSIVSGNGLYLNPRGMNLTTGNAFTISLTVQSALRSAEDKKLDLAKSTVALIGAAGNIMSVASSLMADHVGKLILIHHTPIESSQKFQVTIKRILQEIASSDVNSELINTVKKYWNPEIDLLRLLSEPEVQNVIEVTSDISKVCTAEIVLCGASSSSGFLGLNLFKDKAIIVDVAVPPTIKAELFQKMKEERADLTYHLGGVAQIPNNESIDFYVMPLGKNECFACMAETFSIGFSEKSSYLNIGDLSKALVKDVERLADQAGFVLGSYKKKSSL